jgi:uncharacterized protein (DUF305 family)
MKLQKVLFAVAVIAIAGCGSVKESNSLFNDADAMFAQMMIPHHEQAIVLAEIAENPTSGASPEVTSLAAQIKSAQGPEVQALAKTIISDQQVEIDQMKSMLANL